MPRFGGFCALEPNLEALQLAAKGAYDRYIALGQKPEADAVLDAYVRLRAELDALAVRMAARGTSILREHEEQARVRQGRPDTDGLGGPRLKDFLVCEPITAFGQHGAVGIVDYDLLDAEVPWWWTQERGYGGNVGRIVFGAFFHPGPETRPSGALDKEHAIFEPRASAGQRKEDAVFGGEVTKRGSMEIRKPIAAKRFLEPAAHEIEAEWLGLATRAIDAYVAEVALIP